MARVWPGLVVSPATSPKRVNLLREALGDDAHRSRAISLQCEVAGHPLVAAVFSRRKVRCRKSSLNSLSLPPEARLR